MNLRHVQLFGLVLATCLAGCRLVPNDDAQVTPQRPTLSSDTSTTAAGTIEIEAGIAWDHNDSFATPLLHKYGASDRTELVAGFTPLVVSNMPGDHEEGIGDVILGIRHRLADEDDYMPSTAVLVNIKLPTASADEGLGSGEIDVSLGGAATKTIERMSITGYYTLDILGDPTGGTFLGHTLALAGSRPIIENLSGFAELGAVLIPEDDDHAVFATLGATYALGKNMVMDAAVVVGLNSDAGDTQLVIGFTRNLGSVRNFKPRR